MLLCLFEVFADLYRSGVDKRVPKLCVAKKSGLQVTMSGVPTINVVEDEQMSSEGSVNAPIAPPRSPSVHSARATSTCGTSGFTFRACIANCENVASRFCRSRKKYIGIQSNTPNGSCWCTIRAQQCSGLGQKRHKRSQKFFLCCAMCRRNTRRCERGCSPSRVALKRCDVHVLQM